MSKYIKDKNLCYWKTKHLFKKVSVILVLTLIIQSMYGYNTFSAEQDTYTDTVPDTEAPSSPANLTASAVSGSALSIIPNTHSNDITAAVSGSSITLSWNSSSDNIGVEGYKVYSNDTLIGTSDKTEYIYSGLINGSTYKVYVTAYDKAGNESLQSNKVKLNTDYQNITADIQPPSTPTNVLLSAVSGSAILLVWDASTDDIGIEGYEVYKNGVMIGFTEETNFIDNDFNADINDLYSIAAFDLAGNRSIESEAVSFKPQVEENPYEYKTDRFIVKYKNEKGKANLKDYLKNSLKGNRKFNKNYLEVIVLDKKVKPEDFINDIKEKKNNKKSSFDYNSDIEYIQPDFQFMASSADPYNEQQWGIENPQTEDNDQLIDDMVDSEVMDNVNEPDLGLPEIPGVVDSNPQSDVTDNTSVEDTTQNNNSETSELLAIDTDVSSAWSLSKGEGVVVAVLDTGIDITQEDLKENIWINQGEIPSNGVDDDHNGFIDDINGWNFTDNTNQVHDPMNVNDEWHGTHIAGIIAAEEDNNLGISGVAPDATIIPLKVFHDGIAYTSDIIAALEYAEVMGVKIVNCSWGSTEDNPALKEAINNSGMLFICAAGNSLINIDNHPVYPASYDIGNIISVASINKYGILSAFSNYGEFSVDVAAPGEDIISTTPDNQYNASSGTSMAAAFVSGEAALLLGINRDYKATDVKESIIATSEHFSSLMGMINNGNKINYYNALNSIISTEIIQIDAVDYNDYSSSEGSTKSDYSLYSSGTWEQKSYIPIAISNPKCTSLNGYVYVAGGDRPDGLSYSKTYRYNPATNIWDQLADMNYYRSGHVLAAANGKLYAIGGYYSVSQIEEYNPVSGAWTILNSYLPTIRYRACVSVVDNIIYVIGGMYQDYNTPFNTVEAYNPATNTWTKKASMISPRYDAMATVINGKIYVTGGITNGNYNSTMEMYDPVSNTWSLKASINGVVGSMCMEACDGNLYYFDTRYVNKYSPLSNSWTVCSNMYGAADMRFGTITLNDSVYLVGGYYGPNTVWAFKPNDGNDILNAVKILEEAETLNQIDYTGDQDYYSFTASTTKAYDIYTTGILDTYGYLYDSNGVLIAENDDFNGGINFHITANLTAGSKYNVMVRHKTNSSTGLYGLRIAKALSTPANISYSTNVNLISLSWSQVQYATGYDIEVDGTIFSCGAITNYSHTNPTLDVAHAYRVRAKSSVNTGPWSNYILVAPLGSTWQLKANMTFNRYYLGSAYLNGKIYAIGGYGYNNTVSNAVEEYDINTNTWRAKRGMSIARYGLGVVALNGKIYAIGGYSTGYVGTVEEYNPVTDTWTRKSDMPTARAFFGITVLNGKIYIIGGKNGTTIYSSVEVFDPLTNSWTTQAPINTARYLLSATTINNKIYAIGGYNQTTLNKVEEYDPTLNKWTYKTGLNTYRYGLDTVTVNGEIYAIGGVNDNQLLKSFEVYSPTTNMWINKGDKLIKSCYFDTVSADGKLYVIGGYNNIYGCLSAVEALPVNNETYEYIYDSNNRLQEIKKSGNTIYVFTYDKNGNLTGVQSK